jgi:ribosomal protein S18 acetylase RimI-like enzyme
LERNKIAYKNDEDTVVDEIAHISGPASRRQGGSESSCSDGSPEKVGLAVQLWGIDWATHFPSQIGTTVGTTAELISYEEFSTFVAQHYSEIFPARNLRFRQLQSNLQHGRFYREVVDLFGFRSDGGLIGVFAGHPTDWNTYYVRTTGILPKFQGQGLLVAILKILYEVLAEHNVERIECDVDVSNGSGLARLMKTGFVGTGQTLSERWGAMVKLTKFLNPNCEHTFNRQFCSSYNDELGGQGNLVAGVSI